MCAEMLRHCGAKSLNVKVQKIVINHRTAMIHRPSRDDPMRTVCPYVKPTAPDHYETTAEDPSRELRDLLNDNGVKEDVAAWLVGKGITKVAAFADMAAERAGIIKNVGRTASLDPEDAVAYQPLVTARRNA